MVASDVVASDGSTRSVGIRSSSASSAAYIRRSVAMRRRRATSVDESSVGSISFFASFAKSARAAATLVSKPLARRCASNSCKRCSNSSARARHSLSRMDVSFRACASSSSWTERLSDSSDGINKPNIPFFQTPSMVSVRWPELVQFLILWCVNSQFTNAGKKCRRKRVP